MGTGTSGFFSDVVLGKVGVPVTKQFKPLFWSAEIAEASEWFEAVGLGYFDDHINSSIPTYFEMNRAVAFALVNMKWESSPPTLLDLGASEGTFCAAVSEGSRGKIKVFALEPNHEMQAQIRSRSQLIRIVDAVLTSKDEPVEINGGRRTRPYKFEGNFSVITEFMTFQFITDERCFFLSRISNCISENGIFISCEKFISEDKDEFVDNEIQKDVYKSYYFSEYEIRKKNEDILKQNMNRYMVGSEKYEEFLKDYFLFVVKFWDSGNFKGYAATNNEKVLDEFLKYCSNLNSAYSRELTPVIIE